MGFSFEAEIKKQEDVDGAYVEIPFDVYEVFGAKRVKVKAVFDGEEYRGSIVRMGECYLIGIPKAIRKKISKEPGDIITVEVAKDEDERTVELPLDLVEALEGNKEAKTFFDGLSYTKRKEYEQWITSAKKEVTRRARVEQAVILLKDKKALK